jgi:hypothetical protein
MQCHWTWRAKSFENINQPNVKADKAGDSWVVSMSKGGFSWGYCFALSEEARSHILWHCSVDIHGASGDISPGIAFHDRNSGMLFQVNNSLHTAELRLVRVNKETIRNDLFNIPGIGYPYAIILEYNAITAKCLGGVMSVSQKSRTSKVKKIFEFQLPRGDVPAIEAVSAVEIVTSMAAGDDNEGEVAYGNLVLNCE